MNLDNLDDWPNGHRYICDYNLYPDEGYCNLDCGTHLLAEIKRLRAALEDKQ